MIVLYILIFGIVSLTIFLLVPAIAEQISELNQALPSLYEQALKFFSGVESKIDQDGNLANEIQAELGEFRASLIKATGNVFETLIGIFGGLVSFFSVLVITFYISVEAEAIKRVVFFSVPRDYQQYTMNLINAIQRKIGLWLRGQVILMIIIGAMTYIGLSFIGIKYALVLALLAGLAEFIPFLGPVIAAIPAVFVAVVQSPLHLLLVIVVYVVIQQLENNIIVPKVMQRAVWLNPLVIIVVLLVGARFAGVVGAILAVPVATAISVIVRDKLGMKKLGYD